MCSNSHVHGNLFIACEEISIDWMATTSSFNSGGLLIFLVIIIFLLGRRVMRQRKGTKYTVRSIFLTPIIYTALTVYLLIGVPFWQDLVILAVIIAGTVAGLALGQRSDLFEQDGKILYRRSNEVMVLWMVGYIIRIGIDLFFNPLYIQGPSASSASIATYESSMIVFGADILLAFSAGLLLGEAVVLYRNYNARYMTRSA